MDDEKKPVLYLKPTTLSYRREVEPTGRWKIRREKNGEVGLYIEIEVNGDVYFSYEKNLEILYEYEEREWINESNSM